MITFITITATFTGVETLVFPDSISVENTFHFYCCLCNLISVHHYHYCKFVTTVKLSRYDNRIKKLCIFRKYFCKYFFGFNVAITYVKTVILMNTSHSFFPNLFHGIEAIIKIPVSYYKIITGVNNNTPSRRCICWRRLQGALIKANIFTSLIRLQKTSSSTSIYLSWLYVFKTFSRRRQDVFKTLA